MTLMLVLPEQIVSLRGLIFLPLVFASFFSICLVLTFILFFFVFHFVCLWSIMLFITWVFFYSLHERILFHGWKNC